MIVISRAGDFSLKNVAYELSPFPPALFRVPCIFRKADKPQLATAIEEYASGKSEQAISKFNKIPETDNYILDGDFFFTELHGSK